MKLKWNTIKSTFAQDFYPFGILGGGLVVDWEIKIANFFSFCDFLICCKSLILRRFGARAPEVEEPTLTARSIIFEFEVDEVAEPKALPPQELLKLISKYGSSRKTALVIGASDAFIRQNIKSCKL